MSGLEESLADRVFVALLGASGERGAALLQRSAHADFQSNGVLPLARKMRVPAGELAAKVVENSYLGEIADRRGLRTRLHQPDAARRHA